MSYPIKFKARESERFYKTGNWCSDGGVWLANSDTVENRAIKRAVKDLSDGIHSLNGYETQALRKSLLDSIGSQAKGTVWLKAIVTTEARMRYGDKQTVECLAVKVTSEQLEVVAWVSPKYLALLLECERIELCEPKLPIRGFKAGNHTTTPDVLVMPMRV